MFNKTKNIIIWIIIWVSIIWWWVFAAQKWSIWDLFHYGIEDNWSATSNWRLFWENIKDETITTNEIKDWEVKTSDLWSSAVTSEKIWAWEVK